MDDVTHDKVRSRYAVETKLGTAVADYVIKGDTIIFTHTEVPAALEGRGIASRLIQFALADTRGRDCRSCRNVPSFACILSDILSGRIC